MHHHKRGQLSYEYILVIGMILLLAVPFFYSFFRYLLGGFSNQMNADMVLRVAHATETLANLGGVGSRIEIPVRRSSVMSNLFQNGFLSITTASGQVYSARPGTKKIRLGGGALLGDGAAHIPIINTYLDYQVIGREPAVVGLCPQAEDPYSPRCSETGTTVTPSEGFRILGANFVSGSEAVLSKVQGQTGGCSTFTPCVTASDCEVGYACQNGICSESTPPATMTQGGLILDVGTSQTGTGTYAVAVANPGGSLTTCVVLTVQPQQPALCGNNVREENEECDGTDAVACPGACKPNCKCSPQELG